MQVHFRADSSYTVSVNGKYALGGRYYVNKDTMRISDPACDPTYYGTYKLDFFAQDSVRLTVVQDTCAGRRRAYDKGTIGRAQAERLNSSK